MGLREIGRELATDRWGTCSSTRRPQCVDVGWTSGGRGALRSRRVPNLGWPWFGVCPCSLLGGSDVQTKWTLFGFHTCAAGVKFTSRPQLFGRGVDVWRTRCTPIQAVFLIWVGPGSECAASARCPHRVQNEVDAVWISHLHGGVKFTSRPQLFGRGVDVWRTRPHSDPGVFLIWVGLVRSVPVLAFRWVDVQNEVDAGWISHVHGEV